MEGRKVKGIWVLIRILPVISWSFGSVFLGLGVAVNQVGWPNVNKLDITLVIISTVLLQGLLAHSFNDITDWETGTDSNSPGILSGGSGVIPGELLDKRDLTIIARVSIILVLAIALYFVITIGFEVLIFLFVGLWSAITYSRSPFKLAYRPWLGEWGCAWPAMVACTVGTSFIISNGRWFLESVLLGMLHATFCIIWLMMHHIPDIDADLNATPPKWTTVAYYREKDGWSGVNLVIKKYLIIGLFMALIGGFYLRRTELIIIPGLLFGAVYLQLRRTDFEQVESVTRTELLTIGLTVVNACGLSFLLLS